jgi:hypothetical protein
MINRLGYSYDGITWSASTNGNSLFSGTSTTVGGIIYNGTKWYACGNSGSTPPFTSIITSSYDGINWQSINSNINNFYGGTTYPGSLIFTGSKYFTIATGSSGALSRINYSYDGITWSASTNGNTYFQNYMNTIAWNGSDLFVAGGTHSGANNRVARSYDGITWSATSNGNSVWTISLNRVVWNGTMWVGGGSGTNRIGYSYNGNNWSIATSANSIFTGNTIGLAWNGTLWAAAGNRGVGYSYNGINWFASPNGQSLIGSTGFGYDIVWNGSMFVMAVIYSASAATVNAPLYSYDGITWSASTNGNTIFSGTPTSYGTTVINSHPAPNLYPPIYL